VKRRMALRDAARRPRFEGSTDSAKEAAFPEIVSDVFTVELDRLVEFDAIHFHAAVFFEVNNRAGLADEFGHTADDLDVLGKSSAPIWMVDHFRFSLAPEIPRGAGTG
jgi:hypothetical protein